MSTQASGWVTAGFAVLPCLVAALGLAAVRRAARERFVQSSALVVVWFALWAALAATGVLARFDVRPPPLALMMATSLLGGLALGASPIAGRVTQAWPLWALVSAQGFRFPLELLMHQAAREHVMPSVLSWSGDNYDVITGASAFVIAYALRRGAAPLWAWLWNIYGSLCLCAIAVIAVLSAPNLAAFGPEQVNSWVTRWPFVWLPSVLVVFAIAGQVSVFRKLTAAGRGPRASAVAAAASATPASVRIAPRKP